MIARSLGSAIVLALPLLLTAQSRVDWRSAAPTDSYDEGAPVVRVWIPGTWTFRFGQPVPVSFEVSEPAHVAVFRVDGGGRLSVLWPQRQRLQTAVQAGQEYRVTGSFSSYAAFGADYGYGQGMVIAIASHDPIDLTQFRRYWNDASFYRNVSSQRPYLGGVRYIVDRLAQEVLFEPDTPFDYDVAFYSVGGGVISHATAQSCSYDLDYGYRRSYAAYISSYRYDIWNDDCLSALYSYYWAHCAAWSAFGYPGAYPGWCRTWWPARPGMPPVAGGPAPEQPGVNTGMIDSVMSRPVDTYPVFQRSPETPTTSGTTKVITMEPVREAPNGTQWLSDDATDAISIPRLRRDAGTSRSTGGRVSTANEGFIRSPGTGIRVDEPRGGNPPSYSPGMVYMPPVRESPRPERIWRDTERDRNQGYVGTQRWDRPTYSPTQPGTGSSRIDRGHTSGGTPSSQAGGSATVTPRTDATVTKVTESSSSSGKEKPPH
jgi:hypothetical protein